MSVLVLPTHVEQFITQLRAGLDYYGCELAVAEDRLATPQRSILFDVSGSECPTTVWLHQTARSLDSPAPEFRVRAFSVLRDEIWPEVRGQEGAFNRFATLAALTTSANNAEVGCQALLVPQSNEVLAAFIATACKHGATSLTQAVAAVLSDSAAAEQQSAWGEADLEALHYAYAHLGTGQLRANCWSMTVIVGDVLGELTIATTANNPYFGGGLLSTLRVSKECLGFRTRTLDTNALNQTVLLFDNTPVFGAWCDDGIHIVFVTFVPNVLKSVNSVLPHLIRWAQERTQTIHSLALTASEGSPPNDD